MNVICNLQLLCLFQHINVWMFVTLPNASNIFRPRVSPSSVVLLLSACLISHPLSFLSQCFSPLLVIVFQSSLFLSSLSLAFFSLYPACLFLSFLPLSHIFSHHLLFVFPPYPPLLPNFSIYFIFLHFSWNHSSFYLLSIPFSLPFSVSFALSIPPPSLFSVSGVLARTSPPIKGALFQDQTSPEFSAGMRMHAFGKGGLSGSRGTLICGGIKRLQIIPLLPGDAKASFLTMGGQMMTPKDIRS